MTISYIALGSNLNNPLQQVKQALVAIDTLASTQIIKTSRFYRTKSIGPGEQGDYINAVTKVETTLIPHDLLKALQKIENDQDRIRTVQWGPRTLDLDILLYGNEIIDTPDLKIPHPEMHWREFVLQPLFEIEPRWVLPA